MILNFSRLNRLRCETFFNHKLVDWSLMEWGCAVAGEAGELCNKLKKMGRLTANLYSDKDREGSSDRKKKDAAVTAEDIMLEIGDTAIYLDLTAQRLGYSGIGECMREAFNRKSNEVSCDIKV